MEDKSLQWDENQIKSALGDILFTPIHFPLVRENSDCDFILRGRWKAGETTIRCEISAPMAFLSDLSLSYSKIHDFGKLNQYKH